MEKLYAQALWQSIENGGTPKEVVGSLANLLKKQGRMGLMPKIAKAFVRLHEARRGSRTRIFVARERDGKAALRASGAKEADVCIDESLIGGWRLEGKGDVVDRSFKKYLLDIYNNSITT